MCTVILSGCTFAKPPYLKYQNSHYSLDTYNRIIEFPEGHVLDDGHSYDVVETENGYDVIVHFVKRER
jgi:hypothetical protein